VHVRKTVDISAPLDEVFEYITDWERWPEWMSNVQDVTRSGTRGDVGERTHWEVDGPAGTSVTWDAVTTHFVEYESISWQSTDGGGIEHAGTIRLDSNEDGSTRVHIDLTYNPVIGAIGHVVATLFGSDPEKQMDVALERLKTTIETGLPPHDASARDGQTPGLSDESEPGVSLP
jgi:uncharacterized membrane protein